MPRIRKVQEKLTEKVAEKTAGTVFEDKAVDRVIKDVERARRVGDDAEKAGSERSERLRETAEEQEKITETRETAREYKERLLGGETTEQEQSDNAEQQLEAQDEEYGPATGDEEEPAVADESADDTSDSEDDQSDGSDDDIAAAEDDDAFSDDLPEDGNQTDPGSTLPGIDHDLPERTGLLRHLSEVRKETLITALRNWYQTDGKWDVTVVATLSALVGAGQISSAAIMSAYMKTHGATEIAIPDEHITERPGVDKFREYSRPFNEYEHLTASGMEHEEAMRGAALRLTSLVTTDLQLAKTKSAQTIMIHHKGRGLKRYKRVIGSDNPCPLCLLASTQTYYHEDLMPIHPGCECDVEPLEDDEDPKDIWIPQSYLDGAQAKEGESSSDKDATGHRARRGGNAKRAADIRYYLQHIANEYDKAYQHPPGSVEIKDLDDLIKVHQHGEIGPVLTYAGQHFRGPQDLPHMPSRVLTPMRAPEPTRADIRKAALPRPEVTGSLTQDEADKQVDGLLTKWQRDNGKGPAAVPRATDPFWKQARAIKERVGSTTSQVAQSNTSSMNPFASGLGPDTSKINDPKIRAMADKQFADEAAKAREDHDFVKANGFGKSSISQIQHYLPLEHPSLGLVQGFDAKGISTTAAREVLTAADDMLKKYPDVRISRIAVESYGPGEEQTIASTFPNMFTANRTEKIVMNRRYMLASNEDKFHDLADYAEASGHFFPGAAQEPWRTSFIHEFGHAMDNHGGLRARLTVNGDALKLFRESHPGKQTVESYRDWLLNGFPADADHPRVSGYSMDDGKMPGSPLTKSKDYPVISGGRLNNTEAPAQAFEEVEQRGDDASDLSKVLHGRLVEEYNAPPVDGQTWTENSRSTEDTISPVQALKLRREDANTAAAQRMQAVTDAAGKDTSVTLNYVRNNGGVRKFADANAYGQDVEPWGRYMSDSPTVMDAKDLQPNWESGTVTFKRPLYIDDNDGQWKQKLSAMYGGATGKQLSEKLLADGYDGVIPRDKYGNVEIVDIRPKDARGHVVSHTANGDVEHPLEHADDEAIYNAVKANGGITIDLAGHSPVNGYAYAPYKDTEHKVALDVFSQKDVDDYIDAHYDQLALPGNNLGIWTQDGYAYIDISRVGPASAKTIATAQKADQLAVFDLKHFNEIETGTITDGVYTPTGKASDIHRQYREKIKRANESGSGAGDSEVQAGAARLTLPSESKAEEKARKAKVKAETERLSAIEKSKGFGLVQKRISGGTEIKPVFALEKDGTVKMSVVKDPKTKLPVLDADGKPVMKPVVDVKATWAAISDDTLKENWRNAIRQSLPWAQEAGKVWYPEVNRWAGYMIGKYGKQFEETWGMKLTPDLMASFIASYSENNSWAGNLLGIRKFLDGTGSITGYDAATLKDFNIDQARKDKFRNQKTGQPYDFHAAKALRAMQNPEGGVADLRRFATDSPKPADFAANIAGDYSKATADRWVARIMLNASDYEFADQMWQASRTVNKVTDRYGYKRLSSALQAVAAEPEFAYLGNAAAVQAVPWVQVVGPMGSIGYVEDLENFASIAAETVERASQFGDVK